MRKKVTVVGAGNVGANCALRIAGKELADVVLVDVIDTKLRLQPERIQMIPGMAVTAELKVGRRSVISYFLYPLLRGLDESIREY